MNKNTKPSKALVKTDVSGSVTVRDLRIGNYFHFPFTAENVQVLGINAHNYGSKITHTISFEKNENLYCEKLELLRPIKLNDEWLLKLGFVKDGIWFNYSFGFYSLGISKDSSGFNFSYNDGFIPVNYVHELQNIIFSLSGSNLQLVV